MCQLAMLRTTSLSTRAFARVATHHISCTRSRTSVAMSAQKLDKTTPDSKWKEMLSAEEVWLGAIQPSTGRFVAQASTPVHRRSAGDALVAFSDPHEFGQATLLDERSEGLVRCCTIAVSTTVIVRSP